MLKIEHLFIGREALLTEREQLLDEGREISNLEADVDRYLSFGDDELEERQPELARVLHRTPSPPIPAYYPF